MNTPNPHTSVRPMSTADTVRRWRHHIIVVVVLMIDKDICAHLTRTIEYIINHVVEFVEFLLLEMQFSLEESYLNVISVIFGFRL